MSARLGDVRIVIRGVEPDLYNRMDAAIDEGQHILVAYDGSALELMKVGILHEHVTGLLGSLVGAVVMGVGLRSFSSGRATRKTKGLDRGLQADLSYSFDPEKVRMANEAIARRSEDPADYPVPDLAIDADDGSCEIDRRGIYAALGIAEVWRSDGRTVTIDRLRPDGSYAPALESRFLPISAEDVRRWLVEEEPLHRPGWDCRLIRWAMALGGRA